MIHLIKDPNRHSVVFVCEPIQGSTSEWASHTGDTVTISRNESYYIIGEIDLKKEQA